jgi:hypothetical protein
MQVTPESVATYFSAGLANVGLDKATCAQELMKINQWGCGEGSMACLKEAELGFGD